VLQPAIDVLQPVSVQIKPLPCFCGRPDRACACDTQVKGVQPCWWEQMIKVHACFKDVVRRERQQLGKERYDFVLRLRSDFDVVKNGLTAAVVANTMHNSVFGRPRISAFPWGFALPKAFSTHGKSRDAEARYSCYNNIDWGWMAPRSLATTAFSATEADCDWLRCINSGERPLVSWCGSEGVMVEWWLANGVPFDAWVAKPPWGAHGMMNNLGCAYSGGARLGLLLPEATHARHHAHRSHLCASLRPWRSEVDL